MYTFIDNYVFLFKEYCNYILNINTVEINFYTFSCVFIFGWLTSLNPCSISIIPVYLSLINSEAKISPISNTFLFILGFFLNFIMIGGSIIYFGQVYRQIFSKSDLTSGTLLIFIGINLLKIIKIPITNITNKKESNIKVNTYFQAIAMGFSSGIVTSACNIPIVVALLTWLSSLGNSIGSLLLLVTYVVGYSTSIFLAYFLNSFLTQVKFFNQITSWGISLVGCITISSGIFSLCQFFNI